VQVSGVSGQEKKNAEAALTLPAGIVRNDRVDQRWLLRFVDQVPGLVERALQPFGYYRSVVNTDLQETAELYLIKVQITPGTPVKVRQLELQLLGAGADEAELKDQRRRFPLKKGDVLHHELYENGKKELQRKAIDLGYLKAAFPSHKITVLPGEDAADIELTLDTGPLYLF
jgi:translocation and assembly module TamA